MDALKFMKEYRRMCNYYPRCLECPRADEPNCNIEEISDEELENFVNAVEQWSKEHPLRTRLQDFLEKYPDAELLPDGQPVICCARLGYREYCGKVFGRDDFSQCQDCWNMPVEEGNE